MSSHGKRFCLPLFVGGWLSVVSVMAAPPQQKGPHFYNVDREITVRGTVKEVVLEPRSKDTAAFLTVILEEKETARVYKVEISPAWFFQQDLHQGESLQITGSLVAEGRLGLVMARRVRFRGELLNVRDKHGFPNWRGGPARQIKRRKR
jgi:hypothetical protein